MAMVVVHCCSVVNQSFLGKKRGAPRDEVQADRHVLVERCNSPLRNKQHWIYSRVVRKEKSESRGCKKQGQAIKFHVLQVPI